MQMLSLSCRRETMAKISLVLLLVLWWTNCLRISRSFLSRRTDKSDINFTLPSSISNVLWHFNRWNLGNRAFSRNVTVAMLVFLIKETATMSVFQTNLPAQSLWKYFRFQSTNGRPIFPFSKTLGIPLKVERNYFLFISLVIAVPYHILMECFLLHNL